MGELAQEFWDRAWRIPDAGTVILTGNDAINWTEIDSWEQKRDLTFGDLYFIYCAGSDGSRQLEAHYKTQPVYMGHRYAPQGDEEDFDHEYPHNQDTVFLPDLFVLALDHLRMNMVLDDMAEA